jgi:diguanylate cyclase (GGDEF)-like protein/PAS domain S-box-containing protein
MMLLRRSISRIRPLWWVGAFALGDLAVGAGSLALAHGVASSVLHDVSGVAAAAAIVIGIAWHRPRASAPWALVGAGILLLASGDIAYETDATGGTVALFSVGDWLYLAGYVALAVALAWFGCRPRHSRWAGRMLLVDAVPVFLGSFLLLWFLVFNQQFDALGLSADSRVLVGAFPTFDLLLLALGARLLLTGAARLPSFGLLVAGIGFGFLGDLIWRGFLETTSYQSIWVNASYYLSYALIGAAALHPSMRLLTEVEVDEARVMPIRRLMLLGGALAAVPVVALLQHGTFDFDDRIMFGVAATLIPVLVIYRLLDLARTARRFGKDASEAVARLEAVLDASPLPIAVIGNTGEVQRWNEAAEAASGWRAEDVIGRHWQMQPAPGEQRAGGIQRRALNGERLDHVELSLRRHDGALRRVEVSTAPIGSDDAPDAVVAVFDDVTEERRHEDEVRFLADHDPLTGLVNRRRFSECLIEAIAAADAAGTSLVVAIADLDHFKEINDTAGHVAGDRMLCDLAALFAAKLRPNDVCARLSGDEFAFVLRGATTDEAVDVAERIHSAVRDYRLPVDSQGRALDVTLSIGLCAIDRGTDAASRAETVLLNADLALYEAKAQGRDRSAVWTPALVESQRLATRRGWSTRIKDALKENRFVIYLQPIVDLRDGSVVYHEALTRMVDEHGRVVSPAEFLPHAADLGVIDQLDQNALDRAVALLETNREQRIFVNLDTRSFSSDLLLHRLEETLRSRPHLAGRLGIEITEQAPLRDYDRGQRRLTVLRELGCLVAIDDFGTGFSSFEHLRRLPADIVKIDARFVDGVRADPVSAAILEGIVNTAHALSMKVVAEGIERPETVRRLGTRGVEFGQGYLYGRPSPWQTPSMKSSVSLSPEPRGFPATTLRKIPPPASVAARIPAAL